MRNTKIKIPVVKARESDFRQLKGMIPVQIEECNSFSQETVKKFVRFDHPATKISIALIVTDDGVYVSDFYNADRIGSKDIDFV